MDFSQPYVILILNDFTKRIVRGGNWTDELLPNNINDATAKISEYIKNGYTVGPRINLGLGGLSQFGQILYKPQLNELEQAQLRELKRQENWSPESLAAGTANPALLEARAHFNSSKASGGTRKNKKRSKKSRRRF